jgi:CRISPR-associated protein Csy3
MHSQKIGNAIRCIDEWHGRLDEFGTTPIEVYGYVLARNDAIRLPYKKGRNPEFGLDLFSYLDKLDEILDRLNSISDVTEIDGNIHYMMAVLIRGGVFSGESTKSKNAKKKNKNETPENNNEDA